MAKDALGHGSDAHGSGIAKALDVGSAHQKMLHVVTEYDRKQEAKSQKNPRSYYNPYALPQYLGAVSRVHDEMKTGKSAADAINNHMNGALARSVHKALGTGDTDVDTKRHALFNGGHFAGGLGKFKS